MTYLEHIQPMPANNSGQAHPRSAAIDSYHSPLRKLPRQVDTSKLDSAGALGLGRNTMGPSSAYTRFSFVFSASSSFQPFQLVDRRPRALRPPMEVRRPADVMLPREPRMSTKVAKRLAAPSFSVGSLRTSFTEHVMGSIELPRSSTNAEG
jgi:hypothetical protein